MRSYIFVLEVDPVEAGAHYDRLPLHSTLMHWFWSDKPPQELLSATMEVFKDNPPFELISDAFAMFGVDSDVPVHVMVKTEPLTKLHMDLYDALNKANVEYREPRWVGESYRPHVTIRETRSLPPGSKKLITHVYMAEMIDPTTSSQKKVHAKIKLE